MTDPVIAAAREIAVTAFADMRGCINGASPEALNCRPAGSDTNSIAVLTVHSLHSTRSWLSIALAAPLPPRNRASEFVATAEGASALAALVDEMERDCLLLLDGAANIDWAALRSTHARPSSDLPREVSAAWALLHGVEHLREHVGQMQLTRQLHGLTP